MATSEASKVFCVAVPTSNKRKEQNFSHNNRPHTCWHQSRRRNAELLIGLDVINLEAFVVLGAQQRFVRLAEGRG